MRILILLFGCLFAGKTSGNILTHDTPNLRSRRELQTTFDGAYGPKYDGQSCRTSSGGHGDSSYYTAYVYKSLDWCKSTCYYDDTCKAFEYKVEGDYTKCEIWFKEPARFATKEGYMCWMKSTSTSVTEYIERVGSACRTSEGGSGSNGMDFIKYSGVSFAWCMGSCTSMIDCNGFEFKSSGRTHCEIWTTQPSEIVATRSGHSCYVKSQIDDETVVEVDQGDSENNEVDDPDNNTGNEDVVEAAYEHMYKKACRTYDGRSGSNGKEYLDYRNQSLEWCIERCTVDESCKGFEYMQNLSTKCEIWFEEPRQFEDKTDHDCYVKIMH